MDRYHLPTPVREIEPASSYHLSSLLGYHLIQEKTSAESPESQECHVRKHRVQVNRVRQLCPYEKSVKKIRIFRYCC